jgi:uncharacterized protein YpmB
MNCLSSLFAVLAFSLFAAGASAPQSSTSPSTSAETSATPDSASIVRGCLDTQRGNYIVIENGTSMVYALKGVGNKLDKYARHEVEVKGKILPGAIKTGVSPEKVADNPSDAVRAVSGVVFQVADVQKDVRVISKRCKAAD